MAPDVSIIIVSWNAKAYLKECLESLMEQAPADAWEVIVVDNNSADGSPEMAAREFPRTKVIRTGANLGFARGNNIGVRASSGRYLCFINSDVHVMPGCVEKLVAFMEEHPSVGMAGPQILNKDRTVQPSCRTFPTLLGSVGQAFALDAILPARIASDGFFSCDARIPYHEVEVLSGCFWIVRRAALDEVGLLDETFFMYSEDIDWCKRFWKHGWKIAHCTQAQAIHYGAASSSNAPIRFFLEMQKARLLYWRKHYGRAGSVAGSAVMLMHQLLRIPPRILMFCLAPSSREGNSFKIRRSTACIKWLLHI